AQYGRCRLLLADGRCPEGWKRWEQRRWMTPPLVRAPPALGVPEWRGEDLAGRKLLVVGEQGLGDHMMFARFVAPLQAMGAEVVLICPASLAALVAGPGAAGAAGQTAPAA